eukprot:gene6149-4428_t
MQKICLKLKDAMVSLLARALKRDRIKKKDNNNEKGMNHHINYSSFLSKLW